MFRLGSPKIPTAGTIVFATLVLVPISGAACVAGEPEPPDQQTARCGVSPVPAVIDVALSNQAPELAAAVAELGAVVSVEFPENLDFSPDNEEAVAESRKRFRGFLEAMTTHGVQTSDLYRSAAAATPAIKRDACIGRLATVSWFVYQLETAPIPAIARTGDHAEDKIAAYCGALQHKAIPLKQTLSQIESECDKVATR